MTTNKAQSTRKATSKQAPDVTKSTTKATKQPTETLSKAGYIKAGLCPHDQTKLTFDKDTHRATCSKCKHIVYFLSAHALGCITCRRERNKKS